MLQNLHVKNLALIDEAEVEFGEGLNVLSGETGAGKSIIIGSMNLALGNKVPKEMLRESDDTAFVELVFSVDSPQTISQLRELDVEVEDGTVILSRKISAGRAIAKVNGEAVSTARMKEIASLLIDIHGQHEHQSLLNKRKHLDFVDRYAKNDLLDKKEKLADLYAKFKKLNEEYTNSNLDVQERNRELSLLQYEVKEIEDANPLIGEDEELESSFRRISNGKKILESFTTAMGYTSSDMDGASDLIGRAVRELSLVTRYDENATEFEERLSEIENLLSDFNHELGSYISGLSFDDETFYQIQCRLDLINHLKSKYGDSVEEILKAKEERQERLDILLHYEEYTKKLKQELNVVEMELSDLCGEVSEIRQKASKQLTEDIITSLKELNFLDVRFDIDFKRMENYSSGGYDDVEFLISTNPGEPLKPLDKIASGGEMSRIMLALKTIMADRDDIEALIFDEIDSGISGRTAQMVSEKMNVLGKNHQIICITHLPQIAAMADKHFLIEKNVENGKTVSNISELNEEESVKELARMLGGVEITDTVVSNAREMKNLAKSKK